MKLVINLEDISVYEDEDLATIIKETIQSEIKSFVQKLVRETMIESKKEVEKAVKIALKHDWKKVANILSELK